MNRRSLLQGLLGLPFVPVFLKGREQVEPPPPEDEYEAIIESNGGTFEYYKPDALMWRNPNRITYRKRKR